MPTEAVEMPTEGAEMAGVSVSVGMDTLSGVASTNVDKDALSGVEYGFPGAEYGAGLLGELASGGLVGPYSGLSGE